MYLPYKSISKNPENSTFIPDELRDAQLQGIAKLPSKIVKTWDSDIALALGFSQSELWENFSAEQIDSIGLIIYNFNKNGSFIIGDETGIGKGRILGGVCRWAFSQGLNIIFFTERENLLSDFYRDLIDTKALNLVKNPMVLHSTCKVFDPQGNKVLTGTEKKVKSMENDGIPVDTNLILTCYSQISSVNHTKTRLGMLSKYVKNSVVILDESHNATGTSNTKKFLVELLKNTNKTVFSSATFIKDESQLELYQRCFSFNDDTLEMFKKLMKDDHQNTLRKVFTYELTRNLQFWRREHQPLSVGWKSVIVPKSETQIYLLNSYSKIINGLFNLTKLMNQSPDFASLDMPSSWFSHGATVNRLSRNLILLFKIPSLVDAIKLSLANDHKAVIVIDSTFSALIKKIVEFQDLKKSKDNTDILEDEIIEIDDGEYNLNFGTALETVIEDVVGNILKSKGATGEILIKYQELIDDTKVFSDLFISPIDQLIEMLAEKGIRTNEISGRTFKVENGSKIKNIKKQPKSLIVNEFNNGEVDVIILTRAGASGISLHASALFKDQRVRDFYELEITQRPTYRLQFLGRVNRKNQVAEPLFFSVITQLPFEQRILNMEKKKVAKMQSHVSGDDEKIIQENIHDFYTTYCNLAAEKFLKSNFEFAKQMGISIKNDAEDLYYVDSLLKRCIVLTIEQQNSLYDFLIYATECEKFLKMNDNMGISSKMQGIKTFWHNLDKTGQNSFKDKFKFLPESSINQFDFPWVGLMNLTTTYQTNFLLAENLKSELNINFKNNSNISNHLLKVSQYLSYKNIYDSKYLQEIIVPKLNKMHIGSLLSLQNKDGRIFGYINNITIPPIKNSIAYSELCIIHIKTVNPVNHETIHYSNTDYFISLKDLMESQYWSLKNIPIDWSLYNRYEATYKRTQQCLVGHPVYMEFLKNAYKFGNTVYKEIAGKKSMFIILPDTMSENKLHSMKKPLYKSSQILDLLIDKTYTHLSTSWEPDSDSSVLAGIKIESVIGGYLYYIDNEVYKNNDFMDFPMKKKFMQLATKRGFSNGYHIFHVGYKEMRRMLIMMEIRNVIWFPSKGGF